MVLKNDPELCPAHVPIHKLTTKHVEHLFPHPKFQLGTVLPFSWNIQIGYHLAEAIVSWLIIVQQSTVDNPSRSIMRLREKKNVDSFKLPRRKTEKKNPKKPSSLSARLNSRAASVALCIGSAANPPNRSVLLTIVDASLLLKVIAMAVAVSGSLSP